MKSQASRLLPSRTLVHTSIAGLSLLLQGVVHAGLVARYTFDDADVIGAVGASDVVGGNNLSPTGDEGGSSISTGSNGVFGKAYSFINDPLPVNGANPADFENMLRSATPVAPAGTGEVTISLWFNQKIDTAGQDKLFGYGGPNLDGNATTGESIDIGLEDGGIRLRNGNGNILYGTGFDFDGANAGWHHLAVRVNSGATTYANIDIFLDGTRLDPVLVNGNPDIDLADTLNMPAGLLGIGNAGYDAFLQNGFTGLLDEVQVYDNALSNGEIATLATPPAIVTPSIGSFTASSAGARVSSGTAVTLEWATTNALTLTLDPGGIDVTGTTGLVVNPSVSTTYRLTAVSSTGQCDEQSLQVFVGAATPDPVVFYTLDNADFSDPIVEDSSGNGNDGTVYPSTFADVLSGGVGRFNEAFVFLPDSEDTFGIVDVPVDVVPSGSDSRGISVWFNKNANNGRDILFEQGVLGGGRALQVSAGPTGIVVGNGANNVVYGSGYEWVGTDSGWHWLYVRVNPGAIDFNDVDVFVDGIKLAVSQGIGANQRINTGDELDGSFVSLGGPALTIGANNDFDGRLDQFKIDVEPLSDAEITAAAPSIPQIVSFVSSNPEERLASQTLNWSTINAVALTLDPGNIDVTGQTSAVVNPATDTTYTLTATSGSGDMTTSQIYVFGGAAPAPIVSYSFDTVDITGGTIVADGVGANDAELVMGGTGSFTIGQPGQVNEAVAIANPTAANYGYARGPAGVLPTGAEGRTVSFWFNQTTATGTQNKIFGYGDVEDGTAPAAGVPFDLSLEGGGIRLRHFGGNITYGSGFDFDGTDAGWHHVAFRVRELTGTFADVEVYLDGALLPITATANGGTTVTLNTGNSAFGIGNTAIVDGQSRQGINGLVDEFEAYDVPLTESEIAALSSVGQATSLRLSGVVFDETNSELDLTLELSTLNVPYHLEGGADLGSLAPIPGSTFTPTASPWNFSTPVNRAANPKYFVRVIEGAEP